MLASVVMLRHFPLCILMHNVCCGGIVVNYENRQLLEFLEGEF